METFRNENNLDFSGRYSREDHPNRPGGKFVLGLIKAVKLVFALFFALLLLAGAYAGINYSKFRDMYDTAMAAKSSASAAVSAFKGNEYEKAIDAADEAGIGFAKVRAEIDALKNGIPAQIVPYYSAQLDTVSRLAASAENLSTAMSGGIAYVQGLQELFADGRPFSQLSKEEKKAVLAYIHDSETQFADLHGSVKAAEDSLEGISFWGALNFLKPQIDEYRKAVKSAEAMLARSAPASKLIPEIFGYPEKKTFLFLLQNSDELRSTGGFIGTYGIVETDAGEIARLETHDIYHLDIPLDKKMDVKPPTPIQTYLNRKWFLRDSNWAPDFPAAAQKALWFYEEENRLSDKPESAGDFDGVIAITPEMIESLLEYSGPITVGKETYGKDNFSDLLEYKVEKEFVQLGISRWQRKEVIGDIAKELKKKLMDTPLNKWAEIVRIIDSNIARKDILVYWKDAGLESLAQDQGMAGELKAVEGDYLLAVDFNMAALKTDAVMEKSLYYKIEERKDGLVATVRMTYRNNGKADWRTSDYKTYTRFYAPEGSELVSSEGISKGELFSGQEFGKAMFGAYKSVPLGGVGSLSVTYKLPSSVRDRLNTGKYGLYLAKQPGNKVGEAVIDLSFENDIESYYAPDGSDVQRIGKNRLIMKGDLSVDREFGVEF